MPHPHAPVRVQHARSTGGQEGQGPHDRPASVDASADGGLGASAAEASVGSAFPESGGVLEASAVRSNAGASGEESPPGPGPDEASVGPFELSEVVGASTEGEASGGNPSPARKGAPPHARGAPSSRIREASKRHRMGFLSLARLRELGQGLAVRFVYRHHAGVAAPMVGVRFFDERAVRATHTRQVRRAERHAEDGAPIAPVDARVLGRGFPGWLFGRRMLPAQGMNVPPADFARWPAVGARLAVLPRTPVGFVALGWPASAARVAEEQTHLNAAPLAELGRRGGQAPGQALTFRGMKHGRPAATARRAAVHVGCSCAK